jgi:hypothetical protein
MRYKDRRIKVDENDSHTNPLAPHHGLLLDVCKQADTQLRPRVHWQQPLLLAKDLQHTVHGDYSGFYKWMNSLSGDLSD